MPAEESVNQRVGWDAVVAALDSACVVRTAGEDRAERSYRQSPNGPALWAKSSNGEVVVGARTAIPALQHRALAPSPFSTAGLFAYGVESIDEVALALASIGASLAAVQAPGAAAYAVGREQSMPVSSALKHMLATNTILYGPPGTGKTFATTRLAVTLCDGPVSAAVDHSALRERFEQLRQDGRVSFVTFHQSYGYEEFVEGLRPQATEAGQITYSVVPGAFKRACGSARLRRMATPGLTGKPLRERTVFKMSLGASWNSDGAIIFEYCVRNQCVMMGWGKDIDFSGCASRTAIENRMREEVPSIEKISSHVRFVEHFKHEMKVGDIVVVSLGNKLFRALGEVMGDYEYVEDPPFDPPLHQRRAVKWLALFEGGRPTDEIYAREIAMSTLYRLDPAALNYDRLRALLSPTASSEPEAPHVFIIDEINRANISKVFGELITLIEPDKRDGEANAVTVKLPYSGEDFSVPANLHIVGTMNSADRSIALLDTALRRRFDFVEVMPDASVLQGRQVDNIDLGRMLAAMNERIEALYDRDHTIGHAYLMGVATLDALEHVFRRRILPLLQEYFFEDWRQVRRVLNDLGMGDFIRRFERPAVASDGEDDGDGEKIVIYRVSSEPFPIGAYLRIYG
ncbi:MAG: AAA family ATPase [Lautropia sp.]